MTAMPGPVLPELPAPTEVPALTALPETLAIDLRYDANHGALFGTIEKWAWIDDYASFAELNRQVRERLRRTFPMVTRFTVAARPLLSTLGVVVTITGTRNGNPLPETTTGRMIARVRAEWQHVLSQGGWIIRRPRSDDIDAPVMHDQANALLLWVRPTNPASTAHADWWDGVEALSPYDLPVPIFSFLSGWRADRTSGDGLVMNPMELARILAWGATREGWIDPEWAGSGASASPHPIDWVPMLHPWVPS